MQLRTTTIFSLIFTLITFTNAQTLEWSSGAGSSGFEWPGAITFDTSGNVISAGRIADTADFDPGPGILYLNEGGYIQKQNANGNFMWASVFSAPIGPTSMTFKSISTDASGSIYAIGFFKDTIDFDPGPDTNYLVSNGSDDIFFLKLSPSGNLSWAHSVGSPQSDRGHSIEADEAGNIFMTGQFVLTTDFDPGPDTFNITSNGSSDLFVLKMDSSGSFQWAKRIGGLNGDIGNTLTLDPSGNILVGGQFSSTVDFDPGVDSFYMSSTNGGGFVLKLDTIGKFQWVRQFKAAINAGTVDYWGNVILTGSFYSSDFDPGPDSVILNTVGESDVFILKLDDSGDYVWARSIAGRQETIGFDVATDLIGNVYTMGLYHDTTDFDPGPDTLLIPNNGYDIFLQKMDQLGNFIWVLPLDADARYGMALEVDPNSNIYMTGPYSDGWDSDPGPSNAPLTGAGSKDNFVLKLSQELEYVWPGDANNDGIANNLDVLSIGIGFGNNGFDRPNASLNWTGQPSSDWQQSLPSGTNLKYVDCNGDSTINDADTLAISLNYGLTHNKLSQFGGGSDPLIYLTIPDDTIGIGEQMEIPVFLGTDNLSLTDFYGIAFSINYTQGVLENDALTFVTDSSFIGVPGTNILAFNKAMNQQGRIDIALTRINQTNTSGWGSIGKLFCQTSNNIAGIDSIVAALNFSFSNIKAVDNQENDLIISSESSTIYIEKEVTSIQTINGPTSIVYYPNPFDDNLFVKIEQLYSECDIEMVNILGEKVYHETIQTHGKFEIELNQPSGIYFLTITLDGHRSIFKVMKK